MVWSRRGQTASGARLHKAVHVGTPPATRRFRAADNLAVAVHRRFFFFFFFDLRKGDRLLIERTRQRYSFEAGYHLRKPKKNEPIVEDDDDVRPRKD